MARSAHLAVFLLLCVARSDGTFSSGSCNVNSEGACSPVSPDSDLCPEAATRSWVRTPATHANQRRELPPRVRALLREDYDYFDPDAHAMIANLRSHAAFMEFSHARDIFKTHLLGTFGVLGVWDQPQDVLRAGLHHTCFSGDVFQFFFYDAHNQSHRADLRTAVGVAAEQLTHIFGTVNRTSLIARLLCRTSTLNLGASPGSNAQTGRETPCSPAQDLEQPWTVLQRVQDAQGVEARREVVLEARTMAKLMVVTIADYLDQMVEVNGWRDHHQRERPASLYPGDMRPAVALWWMSELCASVRSLLDTVPAVFGSCTRLLSVEDEVLARDSYWAVVRGEADGSLSEEAALELLHRAVRANDFIGEPHLLAAQIHFRADRFEEALAAADAGLDRMYTLGAAWDKRLSLQQWVALARVVRARSWRRAAGFESSLPSAQQGQGQGFTTNGLPLVSLPQLVESY